MSEPREEYCTCCDCCGELEYDCQYVTYRGQDVLACPACRSKIDDYDSASDRGDWEYHRDYDR